MDNQQQSPQDQLRSHLNSILEILRSQEAANGEEARAIKIAITQVEIASMCVIRSFFSKEPYSPLQKLKKAE